MTRTSQKIPQYKGAEHYHGRFPLFLNRYRENFMLPMHSHDYIEICYVAEGQGEQYIGEERIRVSRGDVFVIPIGTNHVFRPPSLQKQHSLEVYNCAFAPELFRPLDLRAYPVAASFLAETGEGRPWFRIKDSELLLIPLFDMLHEEFQQVLPGSEEVLLAGVIQLLAYLHRYRAAAGIGRSPHIPDSRMQAALQYVKNHFHEPLTVRAMASQCNMSGRHFHRIFKNTTGQTFTGYIQHLRVNKAGELLRHTSRTVQEIAAETGYQDAEFFTAVFKRIQGVTPSQYRKNAAQ
ncbi:AraC family transcriptional regulator [Paenibacillus gansuensis]|uniref:Helix-turn-helix domain-containing protein n=1 Tax=Paenibacillus gansuensis TaxID=306542 RepID=A0ABW5PKM2_9BACL